MAKTRKSAGAPPAATEENSQAPAAAPDKRKKPTVEERLTALEKKAFGHAPHEAVASE
jgi:hypothetical protein